MYLRQLQTMIREDIRLRILLSAALIVQVIFCLSAIGIYHPDQYFQIIEFSSYQLHRPSAVHNVWEFAAHLRATLQVYLFSAWYELCVWVGMTDPYLQLEVLRLLFGLVLFVFFNGLTLSWFKGERRKILYCVLFILTFPGYYPIRGRCTAARCFPRCCSSEHWLFMNGVVAGKDRRGGWRS